MTPRQDPYRVLGLVPGATAGEVRSAYRRLAKQYHPDRAGDRAVARFLAIQAAYEELLDADGRLRAPGVGPAGRGGGAGRGSASATRASRDAWRARRTSGATGAGGAAGASGPGTGPATGTEPGAGRAGGTKQRDEAAGPKRTSSTHHRHAERKTATPGSTTYDEATQPLDPSWDGGSWYGTSSGTYWTLNPKEYADPRKHGPEYQERARRAARLEAERQAAGRQASAQASAQAADVPQPTQPPPPPSFAAAPETPRAPVPPSPRRLRRFVRRSGRPPTP